MSNNLLDEVLLNTIRDGKDEDQVTLIWQFVPNDDLLAAISKKETFDRRTVIENAIDSVMTPATNFIRTQRNLEFNLLREAGALVVTTQRSHWEELLEKFVEQDWACHVKILLNERVDLK